MLVNSAFTSLFSNRQMVKSGVVMVLLAVFWIGSSFTGPADRDLWTKQVNLMIRQTGHQLLLQAGDSTSRVLPVTEIRAGTFLLRFENALVFNHDSLIALSQRLLPKEKFPSGCTVTVHDCTRKSDIVYGFQVNNTSPDILACSGRNQPSGCYTIEFAFSDFYGNVKQQNAGTDPPTRSAQMGAEKVDSNLAESEVADLGAPNGAFKSAPREINEAGEDREAKTFDYSSTSVIFAGMLVLLCVTLIISRFGKSLKNGNVQDQSQTTRKETVPELAALGRFLFNVKDQRLLLESEVVSLTDKECKVLNLLHQNFGELIPREKLMQEVWINEGVITGRSLDMFVSKLRKKLSLDPELRITNVHGKGYKLEIPEKQLV